MRANDNGRSWCPKPVVAGVYSIVGCCRFSVPLRNRHDGHAFGGSWSSDQWNVRTLFAMFSVNFCRQWWAWGWNRWSARRAFLTGSGAKTGGYPNESQRNSRLVRSIWPLWQGGKRELDRQLISKHPWWDLWDLENCRQRPVGFVVIDNVSFQVLTSSSQLLHLFLTIWLSTHSVNTMNHWRKNINHHLDSSRDTQFWSLRYLLAILFSNGQPSLSRSRETECLRGLN